MLQNWSSLCPKESVPAYLSCLESGQAEKYGNKASQAHWLNQVSNNWERLLYQAGNDWRSLQLPDEAKALLEEDVEKAILYNKWIDFTRFGEAWGM